MSAGVVAAVAKIRHAADVMEAAGLGTSTPIDLIVSARLFQALINAAVGILADPPWDDYAKTGAGLRLANALADIDPDL